MTLSSLAIYPIKSCGGISLTEMTVDERGPAYDRQWMVIDESGKFITQRQLPRMALVQTQLTEKALRITVGDHGDVLIPLEPRHPHTKRAIVWSDTCEVIDEGDEIAACLSSFLDRPCRLVRMHPEFQRLLNPKYGFPQTHTGFADALPFLLTTTDSLADLNSRLQDSIPMDRFRANVVINGAAPYAEDQWKRIRIGSIEFDVTKPCTRCTITTVDQSTGQSGNEPLKTLATYRRIPSGIVFGQNLVHLSQGQLRVGERVEIIETV